MRSTWCAGPRSACHGWSRVGDPSYNKRLAANAAIVMGATILSRATGFFREMLIPAKFAVGYVADVYDVAFKFPDLMFNLLVGGAISAALVPALSGGLSRGEEAEKESWQAVSRFMNLMAALSVAICILGSIFAEPLVVLLAQGWDPRVPEQAEMIRMAARLMRTLFPSVAFLMLAGFANSVLYSYQRFAAQAFGPSLYNVLCILSIAFLSSPDKGEYYHVDRVVVGVMLSSFAYFVFQAAIAYKNLRGRYAARIGIRHKGFRRLFGIAVPSLVSSSALQLNTMVSASFSSRFESGSLTAMRLADRTWQMPLGIIAQSMGIALLPNLSGSMANADEGGYRRMLLQGLKSVLLLTVPIAAACASISGVIMRALFMNSSKVTEGAITLTAGILVCFAAALATQSVNTILTRAFYACNETRTPMATGLFAIGLNILLSVLFYSFTPLGVRGMAVAYSLSSLANTAMLVALLGRRLPWLRLREGMGAFLLKCVAASAAMAAVLAAANRYLVPAQWVAGEFSFGLKLRQAAVLLANVGVGAALYFCAALALRMPEAKRLVAGFADRARSLLRFCVRTLRLPSKR